MPRAPRISAKEIISVLEANDFALTRQSGSHKIYRNAEGKRVTVPFHGAQILHPKTLASILEQAALTVDDIV